MKVRKAAFAAVSAGAAAALSLSFAGAATASPNGSPNWSPNGSPAGHPKKPKPKPKPVPQVTGVRLKSALLSASAFGDGFSTRDERDTGYRLWPTRSWMSPTSLSCANFEAVSYNGGFGNTAGAFEFADNQNPFGTYPNTVLLYSQAVYQFGSTKAAASYYSQARAKYSGCQEFSEPNKGDPVLGGGSFDVTTLSVTKVTIAKDQAFNVTESAAFSEAPGESLYQNAAVVLAGTNVYTIFDISGTNDAVSTSLLSSLISRTQAVYPKH